jgi:acetyl esterase
MRQQAGLNYAGQILLSIRIRSRHLMTKGFKWMSDREGLLLNSARKLTYQSLEDGSSLSIYFYLPKSLTEGAPRPVILFFNGGMWDRGRVIQFLPQALHYVERGAVCGLVEYRNSSTHPGAHPVDAFHDAKAAIQFTRDHAEALHLDPGKLVAFGASAGANLSGACLMGAVSGGAEKEGAKPSQWRPNAAVMISSVIDLNKGTFGFDQCADAAEAKILSLSRYIDSGLPPVLLMHGTADRQVPVEDVAEFAAKLERKKSPCQFVEFEGRDQNFFNLNVDPVSYEASLSEIDRFFDRHGILKKEDTHESPHLSSWREEDY